MKKYKFTIRGNDYDVQILNDEQNLIELEVNGTTYEVVVHQEVKQKKTPTLRRPMVPSPTTKERKIPKNIAASNTRILAPLPGTILQIMVKVGDVVKKDDNLLVLEAMKMETNITAEKAGTISSIKPNIGDNVLQGDVLVEIN